MKCIVTAGPTYEPLDQVRRITNFSSGRLGTELASFLASNGHEVLLLKSETATHPSPEKVREIRTFSTGQSLRDNLKALSGPEIGAVFHAAAVGDFAFGQICSKLEDGTSTPVQSGKISTQAGTLWAELVPTPKILPSLRSWFTEALITGWKYEVEGGRASALEAARLQLITAQSDLCVANGPAYGEGFGLVQTNSTPVHLETMDRLFGALLERLKLVDRAPNA